MAQSPADQWKTEFGLIWYDLRNHNAQTTFSLLFKNKECLYRTSRQRHFLQKEPILSGEVGLYCVSGDRAAQCQESRHS